MKYVKPFNLIVTALAILTLIALPFFSTFISTVLATQYVVGVKEGSWAIYEVKDVFFQGEWSEPSGITESKAIEWINLTVTSIVGTNVTEFVTIRFKNGTEKTETIWHDIRLSQGDGRFLIFLFCANLTASDPIYELASSDFTLDDVSPRYYAGTWRMIAHKRFVDEDPYFSMHQDIFWDQRTGVLCELSTNTTTTLLGGYVMRTTYQIVATNHWTESNTDPPSNNPLTQNIFWIALAATTCIVAIIIIIIKSKRKRNTYSNYQTNKEFQ